MKESKISIVIPTYNEEERLDQLLQFLKSDGGDSLQEIIIADGGSSDQTLTVAAAHRVKIVRCNKKGRAAQMNEGSLSAAGSILYFLHADTVPPRNYFQHIKKTVQEGFYSGCFRLSFDDPHPLLKFYGWCTRFPITLFRFGDQSLFVEKKLFEKIGGFDESLVVMEDQKIVRELKKRSSFKVMKASVMTSARRYLRNGIIRLQSAFTLIVLLYYCGASQGTLVHLYNTFINSEK